MRVVVALGGNALLRRGEPPDMDVQRRNVAEAAAAVARIADEHQVVVTHGNGPQVGLLALQAAAYEPAARVPLDVLGAESEGMIGYMIEQELSRLLPGREVATLLTQVVVDAGDPAFAAPTKPIGPVYEEGEAGRLAAERGWTVARDGAGFRRVVASPRPRAIIELPVIRRLVEAGVLVVCAGGGGVPVTVDEGGAIRGVEAVVDKDLSAALIAAELGADALLILTDVPALYTGWDTPDLRPVRRATPAALRGYAFAPGSIGPKVEAACQFVNETGGRAAIGALADAPSILRGEAGTAIETGEFTIEWHDSGPARYQAGQPGTA